MKYDGVVKGRYGSKFVFPPPPSRILSGQKEELFCFTKKRYTGIKI